MTIDETKKIIKKIKTFRPYFQTGNSTREEISFGKEWHKVFEEYNFSDVEKRLDKFLNNPDNYGKIPEAHYLVNTLTKITSKKDNLKGVTVMCPKCRKELSLDEFDTHFGRCSSVDYICKKSEKYFNQILSKEKLFALSDEEFEKKYIQFLENLKNKVESPHEKNNLEKIVKMMKGESANLTLGELI